MPTQACTCGMSASRPSPEPHLARLPFLSPPLPCASHAALGPVKPLGPCLTRFAHTNRRLKKLKKTQALTGSHSLAAAQAFHDALHSVGPQLSGCVGCGLNACRTHTGHTHRQLLRREGRVHTTHTHSQCTAKRQSSQTRGLAEPSLSPKGRRPQLLWPQTARS